MDRRIRRFLTVAIALTLCSLASQAWAGLGSWSSLRGPGGGDVLDLVIKPGLGSAPDTLYLATGGSGVLKSTNSANIWTDVRGAGLLSRTITVLALKSGADPSSDTLYAGTYDKGLFKSINSGDSWTAAGTAPASISRIDRILLKPGSDPSSDTLYISNESRIFKSVNSGTTWEGITLNLINREFIYSSALKPGTNSSSDILYVGTNRGNLFKSINSGGSWTPLNTGVPADSRIEHIVIKPGIGSSPDTLYIASSSGEIFTSTDSGSHWSPLNPLSANQLYITSLIIKPGSNTTNDTLYVGGQRGELFKSTNSGGDWASINTNLGSSGHYSVDDIILKSGSNPTSDTLYLGVQGAGIFKSINSGVSWQESNTGFVGRSVYAMAVKQGANSVNNILYATTNNGIYKSEDSGSSWVHAGLYGKGKFSFIGLHPGASSTNDTVYVAGRNDVFKSVDSGNYWIRSNLTVEGTDGIYDFYFLPGNNSFSDILYAITYGGDIFRSSNSGNNWARVGFDFHDTTDGLTGEKPVVVRPGSSGSVEVLYVATYYGNIFKSTNSGANWTLIKSNVAGYDVGANKSITSLALKPGADLSSDTLYAGTYRGDIFKSTDSGANWTLVKANITGHGNSAASIIIQSDLNSSEDRLYVGTVNGIFISINSGVNWTGIGAGNIFDIALTSSFIPDIYIGTTQSTWHYKATGCGNGVVEPALRETCDDGNLVNGDGCTSGCIDTALLSTAGAETGVDFSSLPIFGMTSSGGRAGGTGGGSGGMPVVGTGGRSGTGGGSGGDRGTIDVGGGMIDTGTDTMTPPKTMEGSEIDSIPCSEEETPIRDAICFHKTLHSLMGSEASFDITIRNRLTSGGFNGLFLYELPEGMTITRMENLSPLSGSFHLYEPATYIIDNLNAASTLTLRVWANITSTDCSTKNNIRIGTATDGTDTSLRRPVFVFGDREDCRDHNRTPVLCTMDEDCRDHVANACESYKCDTTVSRCSFSPIPGCVIGGAGSGGVGGTGGDSGGGLGGAGGSPECTRHEDCGPADACPRGKCDNNHCVYTPPIDGCPASGGSGGSGGNSETSGDLCSGLSGINEDCCRSFVGTIVTPTSDIERIAALAEIFRRCDVREASACSGLVNTLTNIEGGCYSNLNLCCQVVVNNGGVINRAVTQTCSSQRLIDSTINCGSVTRTAPVGGGRLEPSVGMSVADGSSREGTSGTGGGLGSADVESARGGGTGGGAEILTTLSALEAHCSVTPGTAANTFELSQQSQNIFALAESGNCIPLRLTYTPPEGMPASYRLTFTQKTGPAVLIPSRSSSVMPSTMSQIINGPRYIDDRSATVATTSSSIAICGPNDHTGNESQVDFTIHALKSDGSTVNTAECGLNLSSVDVSALSDGNAGGGAESGCGCKQSSLITPPEEMRQNLMNILFVTLASITGWYFMRQRVLKK